MFFATFQRRSFTLLAVLLGFLYSVCGSAAGQNCVSITPSGGIFFGRTAIGTTSAMRRIKLVNNCTKKITFNSFSVTDPQFVLDYGWAPITKLPGFAAFYAFRFVPNEAQKSTATFTASGTGFNPVTVTLNGTGFVTKAASTLSPTSLPFGNQSVGSSLSQPLTITNTGKAAFTVESVYADPPFAVTGFSGQPTQLQPGNSLPLQVTFTPWQEGNYNGTLVMVSDVLPPKGVTLSGTGTTASSIVVSSFPTLQWATQGAAYNQQLTSEAGTAPLNWSLPNGSSLPDGLSLSSQGLISGTLQKSVAVGSYIFTVSVTDSSAPPQTATATLTLPVGAPNGDPCDNIELNVAGTSTPIIDLMTLGTAVAEPTVNSHLAIIEAAMPGASASSWSSLTFGAWNSILNFILPAHGLTANQVVAAWVSTTEPSLTGVFPGDMVQLQAQYEGIAQNLHSLFPNLTLAFYTSRFYAGYGNADIGSPEPYAYESGFALRGMIEDQLNGVPSMNYNPANGPVMAPWVAWGPYDWANGMNARPDGFAWSCQDFAANDGEHNSQPQGSEKDANLLLDFFRTNDAAEPWFLAPTGKHSTSSERRGWRF